MKMMINIDTEFIRLDALLKLADVAQSGGHAKLIIQSGEVLVNGEEEIRRGRKCYPGDEIIVEGNKLVIVRDEL